VNGTKKVSFPFGCKREEERRNHEDGRTQKDGISDRHKTKWGQEGGGGGGCEKRREMPSMTMEQEKGGTAGVKLQRGRNP